MVAEKKERRELTEAFKRKVLKEITVAKAAGKGVKPILEKHGLYSSMLAKWRKRYGVDGQQGATPKVKRTTQGGTTKKRKEITAEMRKQLNALKKEHGIATLVEFTGLTAANAYRILRGENKQTSAANHKKISEFIMSYRPAETPKPKPKANGKSNGNGHTGDELFRFPVVMQLKPAQAESLLMRAMQEGKTPNQLITELVTRG